MPVLTPDPGRPTRRAAARVPRRSKGVLLVALVGLLATAGALLAPSAGATTVVYSGSTAGTQSTLVVHRGDQFERTLNPEGSVTATLDDTAHQVVGGTVNLQPSYTATFVGPFNLNVYAKTEIEQLGQTTGTAVPSAANPAIENLSVTASTRLHVTAFIQAGATQQPATDSKLSNPAKCYVDITLGLTGTADRRSGALSLSADPFTIPTFPNGTPDAALNCDLATGTLNNQVAGANNAINLNFSGAPTSAHYTGVSTGTQSSIVIKRGDALFGRTINPVGAIVADIDFTTGKVTNTTTTFNPVDVPAVPGILSAFPAFAHIVLTAQGTPAATLAPSGTAGIDNITVQATVRMAVTASLFKNPGVKLTDPKTCYVDLKLNLTGTVDRGTDQLKLAQHNFKIPNFPTFGCGLLGGGLTLLVSGSNNDASLNYVDGVLPATAK